MTQPTTEANWRERWPHGLLDWAPAYRVIPTRFPAVNLFDRVASPRDFEALYALEAMTNDRVRTEIGELDLVPANERCYGPGTGPIMAAFTHLNPDGSRFSDGRYGVFYCAAAKSTAIAETRYHSSQFLAATAQPAIRTQMRLYTVIAHGDVLDLRGTAIADCALDPNLLSPDDYGPGKALGRAARDAGAPGIVYPSVRERGGECLAAFRTALLRDCRHAAYLEYNWNGTAIDYVLETNRVG